MSTVTRTIQESRKVNVMVCDGCGEEILKGEWYTRCRICKGDYCGHSTYGCVSKGEQFDIDDDGDDLWACKFCAAFAGVHAEMIERAKERYEALREKHLEEWKDAGRIAGLERQAERVRGCSNDANQA